MKAAQMERILIFNVNWLGDVLFSTAAIRNIRRNFPKSFIACVVPPRCYPVLKGNPHLDEVIIFDEKDRHKSVLSKLAFIRLLRRKKFDLVFLLHRSFTRSLICRLAGITHRIGYHRAKRSFLLTKKIPVPNRDAMHRIDYYLHLVEKAGYRVEDRFPELYLSAEDHAPAETFLKAHSLTHNDFLVGLNPGGNWEPKRWPLEHWALLADRLIKECGAKVIITGAESDRLRAERIAALMEKKPLIVCGRFSVRQSGALFSRLNCFISADSGPLHIANACGAKHLIALFGPTDPVVTAPFPLKNTTILQKKVGCVIPCYVVECSDNRCMKAITVEDVISEVRKIRREGSE